MTESFSVDVKNFRRELSSIICWKGWKDLIKGIFSWKELRWHLWCHSEDGGKSETRSTLSYHHAWDQHIVLCNQLEQVSKEMGLMLPEKKQLQNTTDLTIVHHSFYQMFGWKKKIMVRRLLGEIWVVVKQRYVQKMQEMEWNEEGHERRTREIEIRNKNARHWLLKDWMARRKGSR